MTPEQEAKFRKNEPDPIKAELAIARYKKISASLHSDPQFFNFVRYLANQVSVADSHKRAYIWGLEAAILSLVENAEHKDKVARESSSNIIQRIERDVLERQATFLSIVRDALETVDFTQSPTDEAPHEET